MTLPSSGEITLAMIRTELGRTNEVTLNDTDVRALAGKTGTIGLADFYGKSAWSVSVNNFFKFGFNTAILIGCIDFLARGSLFCDTEIQMLTRIT